MDLKHDALQLTGKLLIAMPGMGDPRFAHSVVFLCAHSEEGAMGLIINKPIEGTSLPEILAQLAIKMASKRCRMPVHFGGPVEEGRGFVLHSPEYRSDMATLPVNEDFAMTATLDVLEEMAAGEGPAQRLMALGYSGWGPGQLEGEIAQNGWLVTEASPELVFEAPDEEKWTAALATLGVDALTLSAQAGRA